MNSFYFFKGFINKSIDIEEVLIDNLSEQISQDVDYEIVRELRRIINGGDNHGIDYLNHWLRIGENRA